MAEGSTPPRATPAPLVLRAHEQKLILRLRQLAKRPGGLVLLRIGERLELMPLAGGWEALGALGACVDADTVIQS